MTWAVEDSGKTLATSGAIPLLNEERLDILELLKLQFQHFRNGKFVPVHMHPKRNKNYQKLLICLYSVSFSTRRSTYAEAIRSENISLGSCTTADLYFRYQRT